MAELSYLEKELGGVVDKLEVTDTQKEYLRSRWLNQIMWMDLKANRARKKFHITRTAVVVGGVVVPAMVASELFISEKPFHYTTVIVSVLAGVMGSIEAFYHFGDTWRHYRANVEGLKTEGWLFSLRSGPYKRYPQQAEAFPAFAERIEELLRRDVSEYLETVAAGPGGPSNPLRVG